jgi:hypothetical protein
MIFQYTIILKILPLILLVPSIIFQIIFLRDYFKTKQKMFGFLAILFSTYLIRYIFQANRRSPLLEGEEFLFFILFQVFDMLALYSLILVLEVFEKNIQFSWRQILITVLVFIAIGGMISDPDLESQIIEGSIFISLKPISFEFIFRMLFLFIAGLLVVIALHQSLKSAWSLKQKSLIKWLTCGTIFTFFMPLIAQIALGLPLQVSIEFLIITSLIQELFQNFGMVIIGVAFLRVSKKPWLLQRQKIHLIVVYSQSGLKLYSKAFIKELTSDDLLLLAGGFSAVTSLLKEATKTTGQVKAILLEGKELRLINRENFICALLVEFTTQASELAHEKFALEFEQKYKEELKDFDGEVSSFNSAEELATQYFS